MRGLARRVWEGWSIAFDALAAMLSLEPGGNIAATEEALRRLNTGEMVLPPGWTYHPIQIPKENDMGYIPHPPPPPSPRLRCSYCGSAVSREECVMGQYRCASCGAREVEEVPSRRGVQLVDSSGGGQRRGPIIGLDSE